MFRKIVQGIECQIDGRMGKGLIGLGGAQIDGIHPCISPEFHIAEVVAYHQGAAEVDLGKISLCVPGHTGVWFAMRMVVVQGSSGIIDTIDAAAGQNGLPPAFSRG